ncbi:MAG: hypothetical protein AAFO03_19240 [Bacteroidota bacterium]
MQNKISIQICTNDLREEVITEMWNIYSPYYHYSAESFRARIQKNTHYALYWAGAKLVGFTGLRIQKTKVERKRFLTIYFGQTVVTDGVRGKGLINRTGLKIVSMFWRSFLTRQVVFWADALTYRAYLVFAKNLVDCYPAAGQMLSKSMQCLRDFLGTTNYGERYCISTGTVRKDSFLVSDPQMLIRPDKLRDPDIAFFAQANPSYEQGSGLLTMGPATLRNLWYMFSKYRAKQARRRPVPAPMPAPASLVLSA